MVEQGQMCPQVLENCSRYRHRSRDRHRDRVTVTEIKIGHGNGHGDDYDHGYEEQPKRYSLMITMRLNPLVIVCYRSAAKKIQKLMA